VCIAVLLIVVTFAVNMFCSNLREAKRMHVLRVMAEWDGGEAEGLQAAVAPGDVGGDGAVHLPAPLAAVKGGFASLE
jgi:hypothetical protein